MTAAPGLFSSVVVARVERKFSGVPEYARPTFWAHATQPQHGGLRAWLEEQLSELPPMSRAQFGTRLLTPELHTQALAEIAAGAVMRLPGYEVELGPELEGLHARSSCYRSRRPTADRGGLATRPVEGVADTKRGMGRAGTRCSARTRGYRPCRGLGLARDRRTAE